MTGMRIACPSCGAEYEVPDRLLAGGGRSLRCSRCGADFAVPGVAAEPAERAAPPEPEPASEPVAMPVAAVPAPSAVMPAAPAVPERAPVAEAGGDDAALRRAWAVSVALVLGGVVALVLLRGPVMTAWPPATRLFAALGLA